jgi:hypothetical protein
MDVLKEQRDSITQFCKLTEVKNPFRQFNEANSSSHLKEGKR